MDFLTIRCCSGYENGWEILDIINNYAFHRDNDPYIFL
jgi:hypothetical protein